MGFLVSKRDQDGIDFLKLLIEGEIDAITFVGICKGLGVKYDPATDGDELVEKAFDAFKKLRKGERKEYLELIRGYTKRKKEKALEDKDTKGEGSDAC